MKSFDLLRPRSLEQAIELLPDGRDPTRAGKVGLLAGGQDLLGRMKRRLFEPDELVDLKSVPGLGSIEWSAAGAVEIGALVTVAQVAGDARLAAHHPALAEAARSVAGPQIRTQGTVGGNLCQRPRCWYFQDENAACLRRGDARCSAFSGLNKYNAILGGGPCFIVHPSDLAPALVALGAEVRIVGPRTDRWTELEGFFTLPSEGSILRENVLRPNEILTAVRLPAPERGWHSTYIKVKERGSYDFALASIALAVRLEGERVADVRAVLGGVSPVPWRSQGAEEVLLDARLDDETAIEVGEAAMEPAQPLEHNEYKVHLAQGLIRKAVARLAGD